MEMNNPTHWLRPLFDDRLTPYIEIDATRLEQNLQRMQQKADQAGVRLRPHIKTHKSIAIASRQQELGAQGITVSKPSEGIAFLRGGARDLLLAYPIVNPDSVAELLAAVAHYQAKITLIVDSLKGVEAIKNASRLQPACKLDVAIKVDVGLHRVGVNPESDDALHLARALQQQNIEFAGLVSHAGHAYGAGNPEAIAAIALQEAATMQALQQRLTEAGFTHCPLSVGATPTALAAPVAPGTDEIRPGNYALLDLTACRLGLSHVNELALSVVARVVAVNPHHIIIDAGSKMLSSDKGPHGTNANGFGIAVDERGNTRELTKLSEEHGFMVNNNLEIEVGSLVRIYPNHSCAVMAQSDHFVMRQSSGEGEIIAIEGRGKFI